MARQPAMRARHLVIRRNTEKYVAPLGKYSRHVAEICCGDCYIREWPPEAHFTCRPNRSDGSLMFENMQEDIYSEST
jgi:hypothetical protein